MERALAALAHGDGPVEIALMWLLLAADSRGSAEAALAGTTTPTTSPAAVARLSNARGLLAARPDAFDVVSGVAAAVDHDDRDPSPEALLARLEAAFDRAAAISPDAAAALYSLGDADLLAPVTAEVAAWIVAEARTGGDDVVVEVGCGPGRYLASLAASVGLVLGLELSGAMAREAAQRLAGMANAAAVRSSGRDLACLADGAFDLVLFADSFPYLVQAGGALAARHLAESARVLRPGGRLLILNWAYEGGPDEHVEQARGMASAAGFDAVALGVRPFALWDAAAFHFIKRGL